MKLERTLLIIKHDGVARGIAGEIIMRIERLGYKLLAFELIQASSDMAHMHYPNSNEWKQKVGERTLANYKSKGIDPISKFGTDDAIKIGDMIKNWNADYLISGPVLALVWQGPNVIKVVRKIIGDTVPANALPGTIRGDYSWDSPDLANEQDRPMYNLVHASGSPEEADVEIQLWFDKLEVFDYDINASTVMGLHKKIPSSSK